MSKLCKTKGKSGGKMTTSSPGATHVCRKCNRVAGSKKKLCKAVKIVSG
jgi:hypothetical protein